MYQPLNPSGDVVLQKSPPRYRDAIFSLLFFGNIGIISYFAFTSGLDSLRSTVDSINNDEVDDKHDYKNLLFCFISLAVLAGLLSTVWMRVIMNYAEQLILCMLWTCVALNFIVAGICAIVAQYVGAVVFLIFGLVSLLYLRLIRSKIPFAAQNLVVACIALLRNLSVIFVVFFVLFISLGWLALWTLALMGLIYKNSKDDDSHDDYYYYTTDDATTSTDNFSYFGLLLSLYWGMQVFKNVIHCTVAGTVASWWFTPDVQSPVSGSFCRSISTSFGSICLGSLLVAIVQTLEQLASSGQGSQSALACCARCILGCLKSILQYFNRWAFCYVAIYGDSFCASGKKVIELFKSRGFTAVINDNLITNVLSMASLVVAAITCTVGLAIPHINSDIFNTINDADTILAAFGFFLGYLICSLVMNTIDSAVATVFVCFAEDPRALQQNYPEIYQNLVIAWNAFHPSIVFTV